MAAHVRAAAQNGADLIELGIPFSDPMAEGSVIQKTMRALRGGVNTDKIFEMVRTLRREVSAAPPYIGEYIRRMKEAIPA